MPRPEKHVLVCIQGRPQGSPRGSCKEKSADAVFGQFLAEFQQRNLWGRFLLTNTGCLGACQAGTCVLVYPDNVMYGGVQPADVGDIIDQHLLFGEPVARLQVPAEIW